MTGVQTCALPIYFRPYDIRIDLLSVAPNTVIPPSRRISFWAGGSEEEIAKVNIPTAMPLLYELDENFKPIKPRGEYLDPEAAAAGAAAVAAQGQK